MANPNNPSGLWAVRMMDGTPYHPHVTPCYATGASGAIFLGDPVGYQGTVNTAELQGYPVGMLPQVAAAADGDGDPIWGVCVGVVPVTEASTIYRENSTDRIILVDTRANVVWRAQTNAGGTAIAATDMGAYGNLKVGTGDTATGRSGWTIDTADGPDTNDPSNQIVFLNLSQMGPGKNAIGAYAWYDFIINNHAFAQAADAGRATGV